MGTSTPAVHQLASLRAGVRGCLANSGILLAFIGHLATHVCSAFGFEGRHVHVLVPLELTPPLP